MPRRLLLLAFFLAALPLRAQEASPETVPAESRPAETMAMETRPAPPPPPPPAPVAAPAVKQRSWWDDNFIFNGEVRQETAFRLGSPKNFSKLKEQLRLDTKFVFNDHFKLKVGGRAWLDAVYDLTDQYPKPVKDDMRAETQLRDAYLDITFPYISARVGHQQIVWGEALGQAFADIVTPRDLREFNLPSFDEIRLPIWAFDIQYNFIKNGNLEVVLSPDRTVDKLAFPGADFAFHIPTDPALEQVLLDDNRPKTNFKVWNAGVRVSYLVSGWDLAAFYFTSADHVPALRKSFTLNPFTGRPVVLLEPIHERVHSGAVTFSKGIGDAAIVRGEFVLTTPKLFNSKTPTVNDGLASGSQFRYVVGFDYDIAGKVLLNSELQQDIVLTNRSAVSDDPMRTWLFLRGQTHFLDNKLTPTLVFIVGLDGGDMQISPAVSYEVAESVLLVGGFDFFTGPNDQLYGQFDNQDRIYLNTSWKF